MSLNPAILGDRHSGQIVTWSLAATSPLSPKVLTGATITGTITDAEGTSTRAITGTLAVVDGANGIFSWAYSAADTGTVGKFTVQFTATYPDGKADSSFEFDWEVRRRR